MRTQSSDLQCNKCTYCSGFKATLENVSGRCQATILCGTVNNVFTESARVFGEAWSIIGQKKPLTCGFNRFNWFLHKTCCLVKPWGEYLGEYLPVEAGMQVVPENKTYKNIVKQQLHTKLVIYNTLYFGHQDVDQHFQQLKPHLNLMLLINQRCNMWVSHSTWHCGRIFVDFRSVLLKICFHTFSSQRRDLLSFSPGSLNISQSCLYWKYLQRRENHVTKWVRQIWISWE